VKHCSCFVKELDTAHACYVTSSCTPRHGAGMTVKFMALPALVSGWCGDAVTRPPCVGGGGVWGGGGCNLLSEHVYLLTFGCYNRRSPNTAGNMLMIA
jgi:hypothetical protein